MMVNESNQFGIKKQEPIYKDVLEEFIRELSRLLRRIANYIGRKPEDNFEKMLKAGEIFVWLLLGYDLFKSLIVR